MHDVIVLEGSQPVNVTHVFFFFFNNNNYSMFFHLVTIQIVFLPTISTGTPIYVFSNIHEVFSWLCILTYFLYALTTNRFHTKQKLNYVIIILFVCYFFFYFLFLRDIEGE